MVWRRLALCCFGLLAWADSAATANTISGVASVLDGDTIEIDGERIRISNIDAPELDQVCIAPIRSDSWNCGQEAARALWKFVSEYKVTCETSGTDYSGRWFAVCEVPGMSIATWMAGQGWAVPNQDCRCEEVRAWANFAESRNAGIWSSQFVMPWTWRNTN
jgi:endonuclease YncB( thermonuclease family)